MKVTLLTHTPEPQKTIALAAKLCYSSSDIEHIEDGLTDEKVNSFLNMLLNIGHESPLEHVSFTFGIEGISRTLSHQLVRHRIASYSQKSQRYVNESQFEYIIPPIIESDEYSKKIFDDCMEDIQEIYDKLRSQLTLLNKNKLIIDDGLSPEEAEKKAVKLANEDARFVLPNACETKIIVTMNIRSLFNFFKHRMCNRAQWEIRDMAFKMWEECMKVCPEIFKHAGPDCFAKGKCNEGKMSCGKRVEVIEKMNKIIENV